MAGFGQITLRLKEMYQVTTHIVLCVASVGTANGTVIRDKNVAENAVDCES